MLQKQVKREGETMTQFEQLEKEFTDYELVEPSENNCIMFAYAACKSFVGHNEMIRRK